MSVQEVTYNEQSHSPSQNPVETYAVRRRFNIETNEPNRITENLGSVTLYTEIIEQLCVGRQRRSQVLIIRQRNTELIDVKHTFIVKYYDPRVYPRLDPRK